MEEQLQKSLAGILAFLQEGMEAGVNFASEQVPLFIQEILAWGVYEATLWLLVFALVFGVVPELFKRRVKNTYLKEYSSYMKTPTARYEGCSDEAFVWVASQVVVPYLGRTLAITFVFNQLLTIGKILVAPRLYLLEKIGELIH